MLGADVVAKFERLQGIDETAEDDGVKSLRLSRHNLNCLTWGCVASAPSVVSSAQKKGSKS